MRKFQKGSGGNKRGEKEKGQTGSVEDGQPKCNEKGSAREGGRGNQRKRVKYQASHLRGPKQTGRKKGKKG